MSNKIKERKIHRESFSDLKLQMQILDSKFAELLGKYFLCEKLSRKLLDNENTSDKSLHLGSLKKKLREYSVDIKDIVLDDLFASKLDKKDKKSFRVIRDKVCHSCSIKYRDFGNQYYSKYNLSMDIYLESIKRVVSF